MLQNKYIAVSGNIGSGKSTLVQFLSSEFGATSFYETNVENPYLNNFYKDMHKWAFHSQIFFLIQKIDIHKKIKNHKGLVALDRSIYEDAEIFAQALYNSKKMNKIDFKTYWSLYKTISETLRSPNLMIYLKCSISNLKKRIFIRNRKMENNISISYLYKLQNLYDYWIEKYDHSKLLIIETDKIDYLFNLVDRINIIKKIKNFIC